MLITNLTHFFNVFISLLYMFRATQCSSSGESIVSIHHLVCIIPCRWPFGMQAREFSLTCIPDGHLHGVIYIRWCIDTIDSPDDEHWVARNMYRSEINTLKKCVKLVINTNCTEMHGQQNIKLFSVCYCTRLSSRDVLVGIVIRLWAGQQRFDYQQPMSFTEYYTPTNAQIIYHILV